MALTLLTLSLRDDGTLGVTLPRTRCGLTLANINKLRDLAGTKLQEWPRHQATWGWIRRLAFTGKIYLDPALVDAVEKTLGSVSKAIVPLYPLAPELTLGWVIDHATLRAKKNDFNLGFTKGIEYPIEVEIDAITDRRMEPVVRGSYGTVSERAVLRKGNRLRITVQGNAPKPYVWLEGKDRPEDLLELFEVPPVLDYAKMEPRRLDRARKAVEAVEAKYGRPRGWQLADWQKEDIARAAAVGRCVLAWQMGLGKSLGSLCIYLTLVEMGAPDLALFIVPQDLIPQWRREARLRFGLHFTRVDSVRNAVQAIKDRREGKTFREPPLTVQELRSHVRSGARGLFITHFEALSRSGRKEELHDMTQERLVYAKSGYSAITTLFKGATIVIDEYTKARGDDTHISQAIRGLRAKYRLGLTGTPVANLLSDVFWLLWWAVGNQSPRFPYSYKDGQRAFLADFGTTEKGESKSKNDDVTARTPGRRGRRAGTNSDGTQAPRVVPDPSNVLMLRRILSSTTLRRRMDDVSVPVICRFVTVEAPWGIRQREQYKNWLDPEKFLAYWKAKFPYTNLQSQQALKLGATLGQFSHLEYASTCPEAEPERHGDPKQGCSNWTPKNLRVLEAIRAHVRNGERVLFGSAVVALVPWIAAQLESIGIRTECLTERDKTGKHVSLGPVARAEAIDRFLGTSGQVLCAGLNAMALGHNLEAVSTVVVAGLPWPLASLEQFLARVRRYSSTKDITVYVVMTQGSLDEKKWDLLERKRRAASRILDVVDLVRDEDPVSLDQVLAELVARGVAANGDEVDEAACEAAWAEHRGLGGAKIVSTDGNAYLPTRGRGMLRPPVYYQVTTDSSTFRDLPPLSPRTRAITELASALSAHYTVPFFTGHLAGRDPKGMFVVTDRRRNLLWRGNAYDVATVAVDATSPAATIRACRLARMPAEERRLQLAWWKQGPVTLELVPADHTWWRKGAWSEELELPEKPRLKPELLSTPKTQEPSSWPSSSNALKSDAV